MPLALPLVSFIFNPPPNSSGGSIGSEERAVKLTTYIGKLPSKARTLAALLAIGFLFGLLSPLVFGLTYEASIDFLVSLITLGSKGVLLISLPAILSAFAATAIKRKFLLQKSLFTSMTCSFVYILFYSLAMAGGAAGISPGVVFLGYGFAFILWYVIGRVFFNLHWYTALTVSLVQLVFNASALLLSESIFVSPDPAAIVLKLYFSAFAFLAALYALFWLIDAPMKRNFGVSGVEAATLFMAQWSGKSKGLEGLFESVGEEVETYVNVFAFRRTVGSKEREIFFVTPCVHYGPFGNLGGSEFPYLISERLANERGSEVFVFHGTATHDFNPVSSDEIESVMGGLGKAIDSIKYEKAMGAVLTGKAGTCKATCIISNSDCFIGLTRAPRTTEDIDFSIGTSIRYMALSKGMRDAAVVDAHNSETGEITRFYMGDPIGFEYLDSAENALSRKYKPVPMKLGTHCDDMSDLISGSLGKGGLKTAVFGVGKAFNAILLFDANGVTPGFRRKIIDSVKELGVDAEVYTTDTHCINAVSGVLNPLGRKEDEIFMRRIIEAVEAAKTNLSEVKSGMKTERIKIKVFGSQQSSELLGTINSIVAVAKLAVPLVFIITALFVLWGITKL
ncbi:MAG: DUF2070 family protein [Candidatus Micrarchaeota archaeon]